MHSPQYFRRKTAGAYLKQKFGFGSEKTLAKLAVVGGGPLFRKAGTAVLYTPDDLDTWALNQIGEPQLSTSNAETASKICRAAAAISTDARPPQPFLNLQPDADRKCAKPHPRRSTP
jgi:hypothetical protein